MNGMKVVLVLSVEAILIVVFTGVVFACSLSRRSRFWLRFAGVAIVLVLPGLAAIVAPLGEQGRGMLFWLGLVVGLLLLAPSRFVLFHGRGSDPPRDENGGGPDPGDGWRPTPPAPIGGIPLPDAEPSSSRVRDHRSMRGAGRRRRPIRQRQPSPSRPWPSRLWPSWHQS